MTRKEAIKLAEEALRYEEIAEEENNSLAQSGYERCLDQLKAGGWRWGTIRGVWGLRREKEQ